MACLFVLIDVRHSPQKIDMEFIQWLGENGVPFALVFTKADKLGPNASQTMVDNYCKELKKQWEELPPVFLTSSEKPRGREDILDYIESINARIAEQKKEEDKSE